ncbi:GNAT family N-acetyltransferase [Gluconacetobacter tumulisoli]|uniref:GNAT family N-acetyltransferase n=1 Tax=Gluconacetobacter tumulisoli TaxID=1286189 RepID=A0A7W4PM70_9PROT|nr:GNAT family N-acetyltransferase [Gluconacetobacter tumulisoli]MBB2202673.1 GNAT family N-acetyltransferase [Gluconacetobacter tumulisoli]
MPPAPPRAAAAHWRAMARRDLPRIMAIAAQVHPAYPEDEAVFAERLALCPAGCLVLGDGGDTLHGYVLSHPWRSAAPPALNAALGALPARPDCWYLHDIALLPGARGQGAAGAALARVAELAARSGLDRVVLVATGSAAAYWTRAGFAALDEPAAAAILATYDPDARLMTRPV